MNDENVLEWKIEIIIYGEAKLLEGKLKKEKTFHNYIKCYWKLLRMMKFKSKDKMYIYI